METIWTILTILIILFVLTIVALIFAEKKLKQPKKKTKTKTLTQQLREVGSAIKHDEQRRISYEADPIDIAMAKFKVKKKSYDNKLEYKEQWKKNREKGL